MNHITSFFIGAGSVLLSLFTFIVCFLKYPGKSKNREQNKRQCEELEDIPVETIKFPFIGCTDNISTQKCTECLQPVNGCDQCVRRLPSCDCDLKPYQCKKPTLPKTQCYEDLIRQQKREEKELELQNASEWNGQPEICRGEQIGNSIASFMSPAAYSTMLSVQTERDRCSAAMASTSIDKWLQDGSSPELDQVPWSDIKRERNHWENALRYRGDESNVPHDWKCPSPNCQPIRRTAPFNYHESNDNNQSERQQPIIRTSDNQSKGNCIASLMSPSDFLMSVSIQNEQKCGCGTIDRLKTAEEQSPELTELPLCEIQKETIHWMKRLQQYREQKTKANPKDIHEDEYLAKAKALYSKARDTRQPREEVVEKDTIGTGRGYSIGQYCREYNIVKNDMMNPADGAPSMQAADQSESAASVRVVH